MWLFLPCGSPGDAPSIQQRVYGSKEWSGDRFLSSRARNQYISYTESSKAAGLCEGLQTQREKFRAIYSFCSRRIIYNYLLALSPSKEHRTNVDLVLVKRKGICLDYAALMACMLRSQGIPTQVVIGYTDGVYHAWNKVFLDGKWYRCDAIYAATVGMAEVYQEVRHY